MPMMTPQQVLLHLSLCENFGPIAAQRFLALSLSNFNEIYSWTVSDWIHRVHVSEAKAAEITAHLCLSSLLERELATIDKVNAEYITLLDDDYPHALRTIHAPPSVLYYRGSLTAIHNAQALAIIGSRAANAYGMRIIKDFVPDLVEAGFTIVSGGALGADSMAHKETLVAGGKTVAVLGSGLSKLYPRTNVRIFEDMIENGGAVVSSFPMLMEPLPQHFPARNRIISGLSRGCLVVQAAEKSGTRITAQYALQQGREVFVVPGNFDDPLSAGCHALAREGALLVTSAADICSELGIVVAKEEVQQTILIETSPQNSKSSPSIDSSPASRIKAALRSPLSVDELATQLNLDHDLVQQQLWDLQWQGAVQQDFTGRWHR
jgi:DNA processing protein